ncbi:ferrous iron transport protein B [Emcibacter nanhaiensis]|uniref:Ferrous iron transport protein B n=1 Tax=Emcibacter nanhaiensis TaxID=1505037 RepID=A0A501PPG6_9PROT|nr:ferrous iron transport protein B [Emcibacter nanhaiensis]TPD61686.1 ferrous iron transport protein B [Emcibacter nanhaiensis]
MTELRIALVGTPNCGKSSLFNMLTGSRQKVANYPGVTVEKRSGHYTSSTGRNIGLIDLPGIYSLKDRTLDERISRQVITGRHPEEEQPDILLCVADSTNLRVHLRLVLEVKELGLPLILVLNMQDLAERDRIKIDVDKLAEELGVPVITSVAVRQVGMTELKKILDRDLREMSHHQPPHQGKHSTTRELQRHARQMAERVLISEGRQHKITRQIDQVVLHPLAGPVIFFALLFIMFQAVFSWAEAPMDMIDAGVIGLQDLATAHLPDNWILSLLNDGILAGVGSVVIFLPQILVLFAFILVLEASGYMARAAFIMDRLMEKVGLNGRAFIPLLSGFACAIPGIMATRTIENTRDRLTTIMIIPLMTCAARLPVYTLIIAAFIPNKTVWGPIGLQGLVMFTLYLAGIVSALIVAAIMKKTVTKGAAQPFLMELPKYQLPVLKNILIGLYERARVFLRRAGTIIMSTTIMLWFLASYPKAPSGSPHPDIYYSFAGTIGKFLEKIFAPLGFNWEISIALVPGMAAREVAVAALGTVYSLSGDDEQVAESLSGLLQGAWPLPTALAFLVWYIYAPQCFATLAVVRRETNSWKWTFFLAGYLFALAYFMAWIVNVTATALMA